MPKIVFVEFDGTQHEVEADVGLSVMQAATDNMVPGIMADCGGSCTCATCHAYVDEAVIAKIPPRTEDEEEMLEGALDPKDNSRLTCQVIITEELDGAIFRLPESQY